MTAARQIKAAVISYLESCDIDDDLTIADADQRGELSLPVLAVNVESMEAHSEALSMVHRADVTITLRSHAGDETEAEVLAWSDQVESALYDRSAVADIFTSAGLTVYDWIYAGSTTEWDESTSEVVFSAQALVQRNA